MYTQCSCSCSCCRCCRCSPSCICHPRCFHTNSSTYRQHECAKEIRQTRQKKSPPKNNRNKKRLNATCCCCTTRTEPIRLSIHKTNPPVESSDHDYTPPTVVSKAPPQGGSSTHCCGCKKICFSLRKPCKGVFRACTLGYACAKPGFNGHTRLPNLVILVIPECQTWLHWSYPGKYPCTSRVLEYIGQTHTCWQLNRYRNFFAVTL